MTTSRAITILCLFVVMLTVLAMTSEPLASKLSWIGVGLLSALAVSCWWLS